MVQIDILDTANYFIGVLVQLAVLRNPKMLNFDEFHEVIRVVDSDSTQQMLRLQSVFLCVQKVL